MTASGGEKQIINCPACQGQLRIDGGDAWRRLRCPHCSHQFTVGIPDAEVVEAAAAVPPEAEVIATTPTGDDPALVAAVAAQDKEDRKAFIGCLAVVVPLVLAATWFFSEKSTVIEVGQTANGPQVVNEYFYAPSGRLLGLPAGMFRLVGLQSPSRIAGADIAAAVGEADADYVVVANATGNDLYYRAMIYGDAGKLGGEKAGETVRIAPGTAARVLAKTHGDYRIGCNRKPGEKEDFRMGAASDRAVAVLGWLTPVPHAECPPDQPS